MSVDLVSVVTPPEQPVFATGNWREVQEQFTKLPSDYQELVSTYGAGCFGDFIWLFSPFSSNQYLNIVKQTELIRTAQESSTSAEVPRFFPKLGGLLPFAITDNGDAVCWQTGSDPDAWPVVIFPARSLELEKTHLTASQFLERVLTKKYRTRLFPTDFPPAKLSFRLPSNSISK